MKTLKMFGMAAIAVLMGVGFASCSKDDNPNGSEKNLVKMVSSIGETVGETWNFTYDDQGRVTNAERDSEYGISAQFVWSDDAIIVNSSSKNYTLNLDNGLVTSGTNGSTFKYNSSNRITKWNNTTILWDGEKLVSINDEIFTYGTSCKKGYFPLFAYFTADVDRSMLLFTANPEIAGMKTNQLPTTVYEMPVSYEFDKDGYISKISFHREDGATLVYALTWK